MATGTPVAQQEVPHPPPAPTPAGRSRDRCPAVFAAGPVHRRDGNLYVVGSTDLMEDGDLIILGSDGLEQLLLSLLAVEVVARTRVHQQLQDGLLLVCVAGCLLRI